MEKRKMGEKKDQEDDWRNDSNQALEERVRCLRRQLHQMKQELQDRGGIGNAKGGLRGDGGPESEPEPESESESESRDVAVSMSKKGYLWKWQDRRIGWNGARKWDLRYVCVGRGGTLKYFKEHYEDHPRYELTLKHCMVRDDGCKEYRGTTFHLFSILPSSNPDMPLLRFSTALEADKTSWLQALSQTIDFCHSPLFQDQIKSSTNSLRSASLSAPKGTLPAMYFAPACSIRPSPSHSRIPKTSHTQSKSQSKSRTYSYPPSKPMHRQAEPSYLSNEAGKKQNYRGILNLGILVLIVSHLRLILHTIAEHGSVLTRWTAHLQSSNATAHDHAYLMPLLAGLLLLNLAVLITFAVESKLAARKNSSSSNSSLIMIAHYSLAHIFGLLLPMAIIWYAIDNPFVAGFYLIHATVLWMKLLSYIHCNEDYRTQPDDCIQTGFALVSHLDQHETHTLSYPHNVTLSNIYYFIFAPTLTYQMAFPRMVRTTIRWTRVITLVLRLLFCSVIIVLLIGQVITPQLEKLVQDLDRYNERYIFSPHIFGEYLLKLALANTYIWLLGFYSLFHLYLNLLAELLRFGDCVFYRDWWNSSEVSAYWRLWNLPVHYWLVRHLYFPCIRNGFSKPMAMFVVFFFSAVMHEVLISIPFHMIRPWAFWGMMGQVPLVMMTKYFEKLFPGSSIGNITFWISFCLVGQPMAVLMYTIDYWKQQNNIDIATNNNNTAGLFSSEL